MALPTSQRPRETVIVVPWSQRNLTRDQLYSFWVFGPGTIHRWPSGDFVDVARDGKRIMQSMFTLDHLLQQRDAVLYDPDTQMDEGL